MTLTDSQNMKTEKQNERHAAGHQVGTNRTVESEFPGVPLNQRFTLAVATLACLALAGGCCTRNTKQARYTPLETTAYAETTPPPPPAPAPETTGQPNFVIPLHQETVNVQKREVGAGDVRIRKIVKTETVNQPVELRREEVVIDRAPGTGEEAKTRRLAQPFQPEETVIHLKREEADMQKQVQPAGEIVVSTRSTTEQKNVQTEVRREDVDLSQLNNMPNVIIGQNLKAGPGAPTAVGGAGSPGTTSSGTYSSDQGQVITDPGLLYGNESSTKFVGRPVRFEHMKVRKVMGDRLIEIGNEGGHPIYAVVKEKTATAHPGDQVIITGKLQSREGFTPETGVDEQGAQLLMKQPYYIEVQKIEVAPK